MVKLSGIVSNTYAEAHLVLLICGRFFYDSCCIMALSQKLIRGCMTALKLPNTLFASADCKESGDIV